ncbi:TetR/AcrR family transcriptional regulator [Sporosalibacterium faouarense]|uniref:TetR/AcrR family transcriptional regulator n=1 Tax=Sporosalibacterium faouarense TaxID=516123 RepID=UPI00192C3D24|nr:TetR/AcrR family transcriptional regulator [Sporosalibacterium faouarense]
MNLKDKIIKVAYELFSSKGYEKTTIGEIIKQAECSKGGFYHHFKSKEEILEVIVSNYVDTLSELFNDIISNDEDSFITKFNAIFGVINEYKLNQIKEWSKVNNVFYFIGNDKILRQLEKQFKEVTTRTYLDVIQHGKRQGIIKAEYPELLADLCTREVLWIYEAAAKAIKNENYYKDENMFIQLLNFSENLISNALGLEKREVNFKDVALAYLHNGRGYYLAHKEELR